MTDTTECESKGAARTPAVSPTRRQAARSARSVKALVVLVVASQPGETGAGEKVLILAASSEAAGGFGGPIGFVVIVASGAVGIAARKWWSAREPVDETLNDRRTARRRQEAETQAILKVGMAAGSVASLLSRFVLFGFAGWEWIEPMQFAVLGMIASMFGVALAERLGISSSRRLAADRIAPLLRHSCSEIASSVSPSRTSRTTASFSSSVHAAPCRRCSDRFAAYATTSASARYRPTSRQS